MTINQIQLANTFDVWRVTTNQLITIGNDLKEGNLITTGTFALGNPSGFQNNVSLNVQSGMIYGDGGLLSNVGKPASITNQKLQNSSIIVIDQGQVIVSKNTIALGDTVYLNVANLVTVNTDTSVANIASANLVNAVHTIAARADVTSAAAFNKANSANVIAYNAFEKANVANTEAGIATAALGGLATAINLVDANTIAAFNFANTVNTRAVAAFAFANTRYSANGGTITGNVSVTGTMSIDGSLYVGGNTYFVDSISLNIADPMVFLSSNNTADVVDIGFVGRYVNGTSATVLTGLYRDAVRKEYFAFREYSGNILNNDINPATNNFTLAVLNADIRTSNLNLGGTNTIIWLTSAYDNSNAAYLIANSAYDKANAANIMGEYANNAAIAAFEKANSGTGAATAASFNHANAAFDKANLVQAGTVSAKVGISGDIPGEIIMSNTHVYFSMNTYNGTANVWRSIPLAGEFNDPAPYTMLPYFYGPASTADAVMFMSTAVTPFYLPGSFAGSYARSRVVASDTTGVFTMYKNSGATSVNIGTINFASTSNTATFSMNASYTSVDFVPGDVFVILNNPTPTSGLQDISFSILGYRR